MNIVQMQVGDVERRRESVRVFANRVAIEQLTGRSYDEFCQMDGPEQIAVRAQLIGKQFQLSAQVRDAGAIYIRDIVEYVQ